ncbi:MAG: hypothetical protein H0T46_00595 [Deltaproteobacteria bacterium]|nr:hypothetical protein [Deltaproteobacteria bacterium]
MIRVALIVLALAAGCNPTLSAQSLAPPGRAARLDTIDSFWGIKGYRLALSKGVAIAVTCSHGGPCAKLRVTSDDPAIAEVHDASLGVLQPSHGGVYAPDNQATAAAFVVVGKAPGTTKVRVRTDDGGRTIDVTIVPPPEVAPQAVVAR